MGDVEGAGHTFIEKRGGDRKLTFGDRKSGFKLTLGIGYHKQSRTHRRRYARQGSWVGHSLDD